MKLREIENGLPIGYLKSLRREIAQRWIEGSQPPTGEEIEMMNRLQGAITACEAVSAEIDAGL